METKPELIVEDLAPFHAVSLRLIISAEAYVKYLLKIFSGSITRNV